LDRLLTPDGILCLVGLPPNEIPVAPFSVVGGRKMFTGSPIGIIGETQEMLNFCGAHQIFPDIEEIDAKDVNHKLHQLSTNSFDARRFVIKIKNTLATVKLNDASWEVEAEPAIDINNWRVHPGAVIYPASANVHVGLKKTNASEHGHQTNAGQSHACAKLGLSPVQIVTHLVVAGVAILLFSQLRKH